MGAAEQAARAVIEAINRGDPGRLGDLLSEDAEILTGRAAHSGRDAARAWVARAYDHIERRYAIDRIEADGERAIVSARVQYRWRQSGELGDESPITIEVELEGELVRRVRFRD